MIQFMSRTDDNVSISSTGSSGGPAPMPTQDDPPPLVAPTLIVANICTSLASMTGAIMCWYFSAHTQVWGTGFFEGALNIGASMAVLGVLLSKSLPTYAKIGFSIAIFSLGLLANSLVLYRTSTNLYNDVEHTTNTIKDLVLKVLGHALTLLGAVTSSLCLILLAYRGIRGALKAPRESDAEQRGDLSARRSSMNTPTKPSSASTRARLYETCSESKHSMRDRHALAMAEQRDLIHDHNNHDDEVTIGGDDPLFESHTTSQFEKLLNHINSQHDGIPIEQGSNRYSGGSLDYGESNSNTSSLMTEKVPIGNDVREICVPMPMNNNEQLQYLRVNEGGNMVINKEPSRLASSSPVHNKQTMNNNHCLPQQEPDTSIVSGNEVLVEWNNSQDGRSSRSSRATSQSVHRYLKKQASTASCRSQQSNSKLEPP